MSTEHRKIRGGDLHTRFVIAQLKATMGNCFTEVTYAGTNISVGVKRGRNTLSPTEMPDSHA